MAAQSRGSTRHHPRPRSSGLTVAGRAQITVKTTPTRRRWGQLALTLLAEQAEVGPRSSDTTGPGGAG